MLSKMNDWSEENPNLSKVADNTVPDKMEEMNALQEKIQAGELVNVDTTSRATFQLVMNLLPICQPSEHIEKPIQGIEK